MAETVARWIARVCAHDRRRALSTVIVALLIAAVAGFYAKGIKVDTNLEALLAPNAKSVTALEELRSRQGSTDLLNIAVKSSDPEANRRLVEDILEKVQAWPEVVEASIDRDYTPVRDHALYYLELSELEDLRDQLSREKQRAIASKMAVGGGEIDPTQVLDDDDWDDDFESDNLDWGEGEEKKPDTPPPSADKPAKGVGDILAEQRERLAASGRVSESDLDIIWPKENADGEIVWEEKVGKPVASEDGQVMLVQARLTKPPTDLAFSTEITNRVEDLFTELDLVTYAPDMLAKVGGAYGTSGEAKAIIKDLRAATWLSATLVALVLVTAFRSARGLLVVLLPLAIAVVVTVALARLLLGQLNVLTAFLFAVLLGIGVDFAVHLYTQREHQGKEGDWGKLLTSHLRPLFASMLTTMGSFLILMLADFKGFEEFGLIAAVGVVVAFCFALTLVPAIDVLIGGPRTRRAEARAKETGPRRAPGVRWGVLAIVGLVGVLGAPSVKFERDMRELRAPKSKAEKGIGYKRALASTQNTGTPVVLLADDQEQLGQAADALEGLIGGEKIPNSDKSWVKNVVTLQSNMPEQQDPKAKVLADIASTTTGFLSELPDLSASAPARKYQTHLEALERLSTQDPLTKEELPEWAKQLFRENNGDIGNIGLLYTDLETHNLEHVVFVTNRFRETVEGTGVRGASTRFILGDLTIDVERDTGRLPPLALLVIAALIALDLRRLKGTVITFATLCLGLLLTFGVMGLWPIRINFYNLVVMPAVVGLGIDASIHLWHSAKLGATRATSKAAIVSALTTAGGFAGLLIAAHGGLRSIGMLGVVATLCCVLVAVVALGWPRRPS